MAANFYHHVKSGKIHFFCPLCQYHQITNSPQKVDWRHHLQLTIFTVAVTGVAWPWFGIKGLSLYFAFWAAFEFFYRMRKRHALICQSCGLDPFLYKQDVKKARKALRKHWEMRIEAENLFAGKKLRNYQTKAINQAPPNSEKTEESSPSPGSP